ncbi:MAG: DNA replication protein DnaD [Chloroflexi bacterium]|jgi:DnaD/phage-associated family protein|nr:MAG: DNA replication protein DnaD [Chloroflexota bacterium]
MGNGPYFPPDTNYIPIPARLAGQLLQDIESIEELKCTLRLIAMIRERRSRRLWVTLAELEADLVLSKAFSGNKKAISEGIRLSVNRGAILEKVHENGTLFFLNDGPGRNALSKFSEKDLGVEETVDPNQIEIVPNIFKLYEENIGVLTPLISEELIEAEKVHPPEWIREAFVIAVHLNHRNWRYIEKILQRWSTEGRDDGKPRRHSQTTDPKEYLRRYGHLARQGKIDRS